MTPENVRKLCVGTIVWNGNVKGYVAKNDAERQVVYVEWDKPDAIPWDEAVRLSFGRCGRNPR